MSTYQNILVTGANRGIGLEFIRQLLRLNPANLIATTRKESEALNSIKAIHPNLHILQYDITHYVDDRLQALVKQVQQIVGNSGLDLLINNAGIILGGRTSLVEVKGSQILENININAIGPFELTRALLPLLKAASTVHKRRTVVANVSSLAGSIGDNTNGGGYAYRTSKAALNMISRSLAVDLKAEGIIILSITPGWVQTDMGGEKAPLTATQSVSGMLTVIGGVTLEQSGTFLNYEGKMLPW